ncbi:AHH domain-containing protein [Vibrio ostreicida]|uniref:AHH domain-containing protein n=1 Tax=Vibrio ostreicida TaxID=526588 RepID=A0ABT8BZJ2_9VIBR|nr:AHH domain-containing protein [Vibrio ostreicida]MDN3612252.1 AHH domain-containing protein [Vibrio ostreicida]NPD08639.1 hypothetical protein [Vibrio ostreicida]
MAKKSEPAPTTKIEQWRPYLKWINNKGKVGEFKGNLKRGNNGVLNASIGATKAFTDSETTAAAKRDWNARHPWATDSGITEPYKTDRALLTPHHLISCNVTEKVLTRHFADIIENDIGYNVNSSHNLVLLPNSTVVACYLGVPPHEGGHKYELSAQETLDIERSSDAKIAGKRVWKSTFDVETQGYHAKVLKLVHQVIVKHFDCKDNIDHNKFIADMNQVSKKILKKLAEFQWLLHENGDDYHPDSHQGCRNTRLISSYVKGEGREKAMGRESSKRVTKNFPKLQTEPCTNREHTKDMEYFVHKLNKNDMRSRGMKVATEVEWVMSASTSKTPATQDNKQTETA